MTPLQQFTADHQHLLAAVAAAAGLDGPIAVDRRVPATARGAVEAGAGCPTRRGARPRLGPGQPAVRHRAGVRGTAVHHPRYPLRPGVGLLPRRPAPFRLQFLRSRPGGLPPSVPVGRLVPGPGAPAGTAAGPDRRHVRRPAAEHTPIGLGDINLRVGGDLYLYKDPGRPLSVTGSLDQVSGTYVFQGRRFDIDQTGSSINFVGDLDPQLYVTVTREISAVQTRVTVSGLAPAAGAPPRQHSAARRVRHPVAHRVQHASNSLTVVQQQDLAVRAGTLAAGFLAGAAAARRCRTSWVSTPSRLRAVGRIRHRARR